MAFEPTHIPIEEKCHWKEKKGDIFFRLEDEKIVLFYNNNRFSSYFLKRYMNIISSKRNRHF